MNRDRPMLILRARAMLGVLACLGVIGGLAGAQRRPPSPDTAGGVSAVRRALDASVAAWNRGDLEAHVAIYADSGTGGPPLRPGGRARARASLARYFTAARPRLRVDSLALRTLGARYVRATGRYTLAGRGPPEAG